jgi:hypothetical protein
MLFAHHAPTQFAVAGPTPGQYVTGTVANSPVTGTPGTSRRRYESSRFSTAIPEAALSERCRGIQGRGQEAQIVGRVGPSRNTLARRVCPRARRLSSQVGTHLRVLHGSRLTRRAHTHAAHSSSAEGASAEVCKRNRNSSVGSGACFAGRPSFRTAGPLGLQPW